MQERNAAECNRQNFRFMKGQCRDVFLNKPAVSRKGQQTRTAIQSDQLQSYHVAYMFSHAAVPAPHCWQSTHPINDSCNTANFNRSVNKISYSIIVRRYIIILIILLLFPTNYERNYKFHHAIALWYRTLTKLFFYWYTKDNTSKNYPVFCT